MPNTDELRRAQRAALAKAPQPYPAATAVVTRVQIGTEVAAMRVGTDVPDQTPASTVAA